MTKAPKIGDISVTLGDNNKVGNIGHVIQEVPPVLEMLGHEVRVASDGSMATTFRVRLSKTVSRIALQARGPTVKSLSISRPLSISAYATSKSEVYRTHGAGIFEEQFSHASGEYWIRVVTSDEQMPILAHKITP